MTLFDRILQHRGLGGAQLDAFLRPDYTSGYDPFLLPDMQAAVDRLAEARKQQEHITIYGDYDIDGLTATTVLLDSFQKFGFNNVTTFIPNRFREGYGLTIDAVERIAATGATLVVTVDCGSLSRAEIIRANELGISVIVTDHHNVAPIQPPAVAVINPKRLLQDAPTAYQNYQLIKDSVNRAATSGTAMVRLYPFLDLPGVGVAFKLVQALQTRLEGLPRGQEKWLLDLVALGTVCDVVTLIDENRTNVFWGLKVLAKTRRPGLRALMAVAGIDPITVNARHLGFALGPRMNAAGRLETAKYAQDMLLAEDSTTALTLAHQLDDMNVERRAEQDEIYKSALDQAENYKNDPVLVLSDPKWNHGIIGIVAAKILEKYKKPTYVLQELGDESKGSARSYGDFSAADAIRASDDIITKGGGHKLAAGVTLPTDKIAAFRLRVNDYYRSLNLPPQPPLLLPRADAVVDDFSELTDLFMDSIASLEPFGSGNEEPVLSVKGVIVVDQRRMGAEAQHVKLTVQDSGGARMQFLAFNAPESYLVEPGEYIDILFQPIWNEWRGKRTIEGRLRYVARAAT